jgi:SPP1 gp7 family putative phage head morphogenesis protein
MKKKTLTIKLKPLTPNAGIINWYVRKLRGLVRIMRKATEKRLRELYKEDKSEIEITVAQDASPATEFTLAIDQAEAAVNVYINTEAFKIIAEMLTKVNNASSSQFKIWRDELVHELPESRIETWQNILPLKEVKENVYKIPGNILESLPPDVADVIQASFEENVSLIRSIASKYFNDITGQLMRFIGSGSSYSEFSDYLKTLGAKTERRAELIAQDQTRKAFSTINLHRMADAGISKFRWIHTNSGAQPREYHKNVLSGQIFDIENPPIIEPSKGIKGYPAQLPFCRCVMAPVIALDEKTPLDD